jgi:hypothetical protein
MKLLRTINVPGEFTFYCPGCEGYHGVWTKDRVDVGPKWDFDGNMEQPTFSPSLLIQYDMWTPPVTSENIEEWKVNPWEQKPVKHICHTFIKAGKIQFLSDCTHHLAGQTVDMVDTD